MLQSTYECLTFHSTSHEQCTLRHRWQGWYLFASNLTTTDTYSSSHTHISTVPDHRRCVTSIHPVTGACCSLYPSFSSRYRYQPYILTNSLQPARPGRRTQTTHTHSPHSTTPRALCIVLVYPSRPCHYKRQETGKETVTPLGIISYVTLLYWLVSRPHLGKTGLFLYPDSFALWTLFSLLLFCHFVRIVFCCIY